MKVKKSAAFNICAQRDPINTIPIRIIHIQVFSRLHAGVLKDQMPPRSTDRWHVGQSRKQTTAKLLFTWLLERVMSPWYYLVRHQSRGCGIMAAFIT